MPPKITLITDKREKKPLRFPDQIVYTDASNKPMLIEVIKVRRKLLCGDYAIEGFEDLVCYERKGSIDELRQNFFSADRPRAMRAFRRLADNCQCPVLVFDFSISNAYDLDTRHDESAAQVLDKVFRELASLGFGVLWLPVGHTRRTRDLCGETILRHALGTIEGRQARQKLEALKSYVTRET